MIKLAKIPTMTQTLRDEQTRTEEKIFMAHVEIFLAKIIETGF